MNRFLGRTKSEVEKVGERREGEIKVEKIIAQARKGDEGRKDFGKRVGEREMKGQRAG